MLIATFRGLLGVIQSSSRASFRVDSWRFIHLGIQNATAVGSTLRPPVVTIMGHVDHGKTTLLDQLRNSRIVQEEFGGITQHIGAFVVPFKRKNGNDLVTFLDTPGHAAFSSMRQRGANITDIVVLVIACEDGLLEQTIESIRHAKSSKVPIIVAINKIDKYLNEKDLEKQVKLIRQQLFVHDILTEEDGGDVQLVKISALNGQGVEALKENILALAETLELRAIVDCPMTGSVIESKLDTHRGKMCTILVQQGFLRKGSCIIAGSYNWARVRALFDERGHLNQSCGPGFPILVTGWRDGRLPMPGDIVKEVNNESEARAMIHAFASKQIEERAIHDSQLAAIKAQEDRAAYKEKVAQKRQSGFHYMSLPLYERRYLGLRPTKQEQEKTLKVNMILKCDVEGSLEALLDILDTYDPHNSQLVKLDVMHYGVGDLTEGDLKLAAGFENSIIYGFNVKTADRKILVDSKRVGVTVKIFNVIYHLIDDLKARISEKIPANEVHEELGRATVIEEFVISEKSKNELRVAGCRCSKGVLNRGSLYKLVRDNEVIQTDLRVATLKHFKDDVKEIVKGRECGISFESRPDLRFRPNDQLIAYEKKQVKPKLKWNLKGFS